MKELLAHPWVKVLLIATTVAMSSFALRETASMTVPIIEALYEVLVPLAMGFVLAYVITPVVDWLCRLGMNRFLATGGLFIAATVVTVAVVILVVPPVVKQGSELASRALNGEPYEDANRNGRWDAGEPFTDLNKNTRWDPGFLTQAMGWLDRQQRDLQIGTRPDAEIKDGTAISEHIEAAVRKGLSALPDKFGGWASNGFQSLSGVLSFLLSALLVPIYAFFIAIAMPSIRRDMQSYIPAHYRDQAVRIGVDIERVIAAFFRGRLIICAFCALVGIAGFLALGLFGIKAPYGVFFGAAIGVATVIPLAGLIFLVPAIALAMFEPGASAWSAGAVVVVYGIVQGTEMLLIPVVMGRSVELRPVTLIVALLLCGKLLGVLGLILAVPIFASVRILAREYLWPRLRAWADNLPAPSLPAPALAESDGSTEAPPANPDAKS